MIKKCTVLSCNPFLHSLVVDFDGLHIQMTGVIDEDAKTIYVKYKNGVATVCSKEDFEKSVRSKSKANKKFKKMKTTEMDLVEEVVESEAVKNETDEISE